MKEKEDRIEKLLAVLLLNNIKDAPISKKATQLNLAGFSNIEIADLLETSSQVIANALSANRKTKQTRRR